MSHRLLGVLGNVGDVHKDSHVCHLGLGGQICQYSWRAAACKTKGSGFRWWHAIYVAVTEPPAHAHVTSSTGDNGKNDCWCWAKRNRVSQGAAHTRDCSGQSLGWSIMCRARETLSPKVQCTARAATGCFHTHDICQPWHQHVTSTLVLLWRALPVEELATVDSTELVTPPVDGR